VRAGGSAVAVAADVSDFASVRAAVDEVVASLGPVRGLVNNAAALAGIPRQAFYEIAETDWDRVMTINVKGPWNCVRAVWPSMREAGGSIVNISSDMVLSGAPGLLHYTVSKGAVATMTRVLAREAGAANVRVNTVAPGLTATATGQEHPEAEERALAGRALKRRQLPEDVVGTVRFLLSDDSRFVTGQLITVNGGYLLH
jgi:3-oxoacyl-[acyl-carrier protein] reductase